MLHVWMDFDIDEGPFLTVNPHMGWPPALDAQEHIRAIMATALDNQIHDEGIVLITDEQGDTK